MTFGRSSDGALAELKALSQIIQNSISAIEATLESKQMEFPSLHTPLTMESEGVRRVPEIERACSMIVAAATQLVYSARSPMASISTVVLQVIFQTDFPKKNATLKHNLTVCFNRVFGSRYRCECGRSLQRSRTTGELLLDL